MVKGPYEQQMKYLHETLFAQMEKDLKVGTSVEGKGFSECAASCKKAKVDAFAEKQKLLQIRHITLESPAFLTAFVRAIDTLVDKLKKDKVNDRDISNRSIDSVGRLLDGQCQRTGRETVCLSPLFPDSRSVGYGAFQSLGSSTTYSVIGTGIWLSA